MSIEILRATRKNLLKTIEGIPEEFLFTIPERHNNHAFWNFAHCIVTQQLLCYRLSGLESTIENELIERYRKGSKPSENDHLENVGLFKELCFSLVDQTEKDYSSAVFGNFKTYQTSYGVTLSNIEDAMAFNNVHEAMHLGHLKAIANNWK